MRKSKTTEEWIQEAKIVHGDKYDYSKVNLKLNIIILNKIIIIL